MSNPPQKYFQLGGYSPHITWLQHTYDDTALADAIVGIGSPLRGGKRLDEPVDLILGITEHGSSHLLLTGPQVLKLKRISRLSFPSRLPFLASDFESLSPVSFFSVDELVKKLAFHKPKAKGKKSGSDAPADSSQANKGYNPGIKNPYRGAFEHGRILFRILNEALRDLSPDTFGIDDNSWVNEVGISSFVFNTKGVDDRPASERLKNPHVLDIGFCNATLPDITPEYQTARHIVHAGNALLHRQGKKQVFP
ncbi:hypothetical protein BDN70DRAFT_869967 [Pholiota conissans]|uniref:Uncharacterized protein n=1 Tax=Pholiota conissans TaxID=109636 RepID=A0A9P5ZEV3_9AGAR|nr:hypothetical protein BDN70DRAFT_869967 [Pholiota conissans]